MCRRAYEGGAAAVGFDFFAFGLPRQSSDGNVSAKLRKPSTNITAKPVIMVIWGTEIALADDSLMTRLLSWHTASGRRPTISPGSLARWPFRDVSAVHRVPLSYWENRKGSRLFLRRNQA